MLPYFTPIHSQALSDFTPDIVGGTVETAQTMAQGDDRQLAIWILILLIGGIIAMFRQQKKMYEDMLSASKEQTEYLRDTLDNQIASHKSYMDTIVTHMEKIAHSMEGCVLRSDNELAKYRR